MTGIYFQKDLDLLDSGATTVQILNMKLVTLLDTVDTHIKQYKITQDNNHLTLLTGNFLIPV